MPYIPQVERPEIDRAVDALYLDTPGKLAYGIERMIRKFLRGTRGKAGYLQFALVCGVLITSLLEFYRRKVAPYEDEKIEENGDVEY